MIKIRPMVNMKIKVSTTLFSLNTIPTRDTNAPPKITPVAGCAKKSMICQLSLQPLSELLKMSQQMSHSSSRTAARMMGAYGCILDHLVALVVSPCSFVFLSLFTVESTSTCCCFDISRIALRCALGVTMTRTGPHRTTHPQTDTPALALSEYDGAAWDRVLSSAVDD